MESNLRLDSTEETSAREREKARVKWSGLTAASLTDNGKTINVTMVK